MTKKDYIKIANVFINAYAKNTIEKLEKTDALNLDKVDMLIGDMQSEIMTIFENDNFRFSTETFSSQDPVCNRADKLLALLLG